MDGAFFLLTMTYDDSIIVHMKRADAAKKKRLLGQLRQIQAVLKGSLAECELTCGTPGCRCHSDGPKHKGLYFSYRHQGKTRTLYVPKDLHDVARQAHANWLKAKQILEELTVLEVMQLRTRNKKAVKARKGRRR
jgi:hypothetical protein